MALERRRILFVGGISSMMSEALIQSHFEHFGVVTKVRIMKEKKTKEPKGFAYVTMKDSWAINQVLAKQHKISDRKVDVQLASRKGEKQIWKDEQRMRRVFVSNLPQEMDSDKLSQLFSCFGEIRNAYIICDFETKLSKGYGYVEYLYPEAANWALLAYSNSQGDLDKIQCLPYMGRHEVKQGGIKDKEDISPADSAKAGTTLCQPHSGEQLLLLKPRKQETVSSLEDLSSSRAGISGHSKLPTRSKMTPRAPYTNQPELLLPISKGDALRKVVHLIAPLLSHDQSNIRYNVCFSPISSMRIGSSPQGRFDSSLPFRQQTHGQVHHSPQGVVYPLL